jgi:hypothetical protein
MAFDLDKYIAQNYGGWRHHAPQPTDALAQVAAIARKGKGKPQPPPPPTAA